MTGALRLNDGKNFLSYDIDNHGNDCFMKITLDEKTALLDGFDIFNLREVCNQALESIKKLREKQN